MGDAGVVVYLVRKHAIADDTQAARKTDSKSRPVMFKTAG